MEWIDANTFFGTWHRRKLDMPAEELVRLLKAAGTSRAMTLSLMAPLLDAEEGTNDTLLASKAHRELIPFGAVDPRRYTGGDRVKRLRDLGCAAVRQADGQSVDMEKFPVEDPLARRDGFMERIV